MTQIKICGITRSETLTTLAKAGVEYAGFVCVENSSRFLPPDRAFASGGSHACRCCHAIDSAQTLLGRSPGTEIITRSGMLLLVRLRAGGGPHVVDR